MTMAESLSSFIKYVFSELRKEKSKCNYGYTLYHNDSVFFYQTPSNQVKHIPVVTKSFIEYIEKFFPDKPHTNIVQFIDEYVNANKHESIFL